MKPAAPALLRHLARTGSIEETLKAFPDAPREALVSALERAAELLERDGAPSIAAAEHPAPRAEAPALPSIGAETVRVFSDGAARGNPGPAGAGAVLVDASGKVLARLGEFLGRQTNNYAEYMGLIIGLREAQRLGVRFVEVVADSQLMIRQLGGQYRVKNAGLKPLYDEAMGMLKAFERVRLVHVPREMNKAADEMSNRAIDERL